MAEKTTKQQADEIALKQEKENKDIAERIIAASAEMQPILKKHELLILAEMEYTPEGIAPRIKLKDFKYATDEVKAKIKEMEASYKN